MRKKKDLVGDRQFIDIRAWYRNKLLGQETVLRDLARKFGVKDSRGILLIPELGHVDFAEMIGSSRPMVSRLIAEMVANQRLMYDGKHYIVIDHLAIDSVKLNGGSMANRD